MTNPSPPASDLRIALSMLAVVGAGLAISLQSFYNGRLATELGSPEVASTISQVTSFLAVAMAAALTGAWRRLRARSKSPGGFSGLRPWHLCAGLLGVVAVYTSTKTAPITGIALLTVALVAGQSIGSLIVDRTGISPAGVIPVTGARILGAVLAIVAVVIGALGASGDLRIDLLLICFVAGFGVGLQQAMLGHITRTTGEPMAAAMLNSSLAALVLALIVLTIGGGFSGIDYSAPPLDWTGGLLGAVIIVTTAATVATLGVLRLVLGMIAGQAIGALAIDLISPPPGEVISAATILSVLLTVAAVALTGVASARARRLALERAGS